MDRSPGLHRGDVSRAATGVIMLKPGGFFFELARFVKHRIVLPPLQWLGCDYMSSVGLEHIDLQLVSILQRQRNGFFVEAGANDGINQSNTYYLEKILGWKGILVEPLSEEADRCRRNRRRSAVINAALVRTGGPKSVAIEPARLMTIVRDGAVSDSSVEDHVRAGRRLHGLPSELPTRQVVARPLSEVFDDHNVSHVDFFSLDVEGYELEVLMGIDWGKVCIEHLFVETRPENQQEIDRLLLSQGFECIRTWDRITIAEKLYRPRSDDREKSQSRVTQASEAP